MSATVAQIRSGLKTRLATITGVQASAYQLSNPQPPTIQVMGIDELQYDQAMARDLDEFTFIVQAFAGSPEDVAAQTALDTWATGSGGTSVKAAIEGDRTLGGVVQDCVVTRFGGVRIYNLPNRAETLGGEFFVRVLN